VRRVLLLASFGLRSVGLVLGILVLTRGFRLGALDDRTRILLGILLVLYGTYGLFRLVMLLRQGKQDEGSGP
jgi:hypothetical protein